jgi:hypothetical protein
MNDPAVSPSALFPQTSSYPGRIPSGIEHAENRYFLIRDAVVDAVRKSPDHHSVKSESGRVHPCVKREGINLREQRIKKIVSNPIGLGVIELPCCGQIFEGAPQDPNSHSNLARSSFLAACQSKTSTLPADTAASVLRSSSPCQAGLSKESASAARSAQRVSMILNFSGAGRRRSSATVMPHLYSSMPDPSTSSSSVPAL